MWEYGKRELNMQPLPLVLQIAAVIGAGVVSKPGMDLKEPKKVAKKIVDLAEAIIEESKAKEAEKN